MLEEKEIQIINQTMRKGYDVEIQHRKNGIVILKSEKEVCCKKENKSDRISLGNGTNEKN